MRHSHISFDLRCVLKCTLLLFGSALAVLTGCTPSGSSEGYLEKVWGQQGIGDGRFLKPRAVAIDEKDQLYIVDMTARIQVFDRDGNYLRHWQTPEFANGKPSGLSFDRDGNLLVADTHYFRMLAYTPEGKLLEDRTIGGTAGETPGTFEFVTDAVQDSQGNYYISEYGQFDRVQKFTKDGKFVMQWGGHGSEPGEFIRPQNLDIDEQDHIWVADACNHRIQVFDASGPEAKLIKIWGKQGTKSGELRYPYDLVLDGQGHLYVCEFGNHRVQKFTLDGEFVASWGVGGREPGQLHSPWALARDSQGAIHVIDSYNHRVQRIRL